MTRTPRVLTFDVVGTLIDFERGMHDSLRALRGPDAPPLDFESFLTAYRGMRNRPDKRLFPEDLEPIYHELAPRFSLPAGNEAARRFVAAAHDWPAFADSVEALARLSRHFRLVAMTNARRWAFAGMEKTLGMPFFDTVTVDDARCEKPDPAFFDRALAKLAPAGFVKADVLHVAQSQFHDIGVARALGYTVCWIERRKAAGGGFGGTVAVEALTAPDYHFHSMAELADLADRGGLVMKTPGAGDPAMI
ncbi:HAD-IA family hydrolase [Nguyenibacter sp. L1]|uniref:HAD-IA family hydrolase n=1 Tax=Nguyenibacter sp. L1 TaxID=3049350 RepID=UPI002B47354D|nr:HAD-IA family hydrolase [Nguyenibacter sp. L1]WRH86840.1 HAD-IA family hydrolase [Nguyenibacter sp. L1]